LPNKKKVFISVYKPGQSQVVYKNIVNWGVADGTLTFDYQGSTDGGQHTIVTNCPFVISEED
jgi:hypothetical protein